MVNSTNEHKMVSARLPPSLAKKAFPSRSFAFRQWQATTRSFTTTLRRPEDFTHLQESLPKRRLPLTFDYAVPTSSHLLNVALSDYLPAGTPPAEAPSQLPSTQNNASALSPAYHLVYFPPAIRPTDLLPDGTDPQQSPGAPFIRRMWAGGSLRFNNSAPLPLDGARIACLETLRSVDIKGKPGEEKIFVGIERRIGSGSESLSEEQVRQQLWRDSEDDFGDSVSVIERRNIVFMRERSKEQAVKDMEAAKKKQMKPPGSEEGLPVDFDWKITPNDKLLFRFSALTYNAHAIHLDPHFCREVEGHRGLVVHGPLGLTLLTTLTQNALPQGEKIKSIEYRNLAPLYCDEPIRFAGRKSEGKWDAWAETPQGGVAVKATVRTE